MSDDARCGRHVPWSVCRHYLPINEVPHRTVRSDAMVLYCEQIARAVRGNHHRLSFNNVRYNLYFTYNIARKNDTPRKHAIERAQARKIKRVRETHTAREELLRKSVRETKKAKYENRTSSVLLKNTSPKTFPHIYIYIYTRTYILSTHNSPTPYFYMSPLIVRTH